jgi:sugar phosphate isomerase/epimerase
MTMTDRFDRRHFLAMAATTAALPAYADPLGLPLGLQLYTVRDATARDLAGTLKQVAQIGYRKVQSNMTLAGHDTQGLRKIFDDAGLGWDAVHCTNQEFLGDLSGTIERAHAAQLRYLFTSVPLYPASFKDVLAGISLDDWKRNADLFNRIGEQLNRAGLVFGYHNHNPEFRLYGGVTAYDTLLGMTDPGLVKLELDTGWMVSGGYDPLDYLSRYSNRYTLLHVKDLKRDFIPNYQTKMNGVPAGLGIIDWKRLFAAARKADIKGVYVEQEAPYLPSSLEAARASYEYLSKLT